MTTLNVRVVSPRRRVSPDSGRPTKDAKAKTFSVGAMRGALSQGQPGAWASDHRAESEQFTGSNYIAIKALCNAAAAATVTAYDESEPRRAKLSTLRKSYGSLRKAYGAGEEDASPLPIDHALSRQLKRPNPFQSGASFRYEQVLQLSLTGSAIMLKIPNQLGRTIERYVVPTAIAQPVQPTREMPHGGFRIDPAMYRYYVSRDPQGFVEGYGLSRVVGQTIPIIEKGYRWFQIIRLPHPIFKDDGMSSISAGALWIDTANMVDRARWSHLRKGPNPSIIVSPPEDVELTPAQLDAAAAKFNAKYAGAENAGAAMFISRGTTATKVGQTAEEMAYESGFSQLRDAVHALNGFPKGLIDAGSYASLYAAIRQHTLLTVQPMLSLIAEEETEQLAPEYGEALTVEIEAAEVNDPEMLERQLATDISGGVRTVDEIRSLRGLSPLPRGEGERIAGLASSAPPQANGSIDSIFDRFKSLSKPHKYSTTHFNLPAKLCGKVLSLAAVIADEDLSEDGREDEPHITIKYGLHTNSASDVRKAVKSFGPVTVTLGRTSIFPASETQSQRGGSQFDVVKIDVEGDDLRRLNKAISSALSHTDSHPTYQPHITLAYVKPGRGKVYAGLYDLEGVTVTFDRLTFSDALGRTQTVSLSSKGKSLLPTADDIAAARELLFQGYP